MYVQLLQDTGGVTGKYRVSICLTSPFDSTNCFQGGYGKPNLAVLDDSVTGNSDSNWVLFTLVQCNEKVEY